MTSNFHKHLLGALCSLGKQEVLAFWFLPLDCPSPYPFQGTGSPNLAERQPALGQTPKPTVGAKCTQRISSGPLSAEFKKRKKTGTNYL